VTGKGRVGTGTAGLAIASILVVALLHACVDFSWYVPAYAAALAVLAGLACSLSRDRSAAQPEITKIEATHHLVVWFRGFALAGAGLLLAAMISSHFVGNARTELSWNSYYHLLPKSERGNNSTEEKLLDQCERLAKVCASGTDDPDHYYRLGLLELQRFVLRTGRSPDSANLTQLRQALRAEGVNS